MKIHEARRMCAVVQRSAIMTKRTTMTKWSGRQKTRAPNEETKESSP